MTTRDSRHLVHLAVDVAMGLSYLLQMAPHRMGGWYHELAGLAFVVLLAAHHALNLRWLRAEWRRRVWLPLALDAALLACAAGIVIAGMSMAQHVTLLRSEGVAHAARPLHACLTHLGLMLVAVHAGTHIPALRPLVRRDASRRGGRVLRILLAVGVLALCAYEFVRLNVPAKLAMGMSFPDGMTPLPVLLVRYLLLSAPFVLLGTALSLRQEKTRQEKRSNRS